MFALLTNHQRQLEASRTIPTVTETHHVTREALGSIPTPKRDSVIARLLDTISVKMLSNQHHEDLAGLEQYGWYRWYPRVS